MPALPPPSMQIGALPPGYSMLPPNGPVRQLNQTPALPVIVQSAGANTTASGPTNITQTVTATQVGTYLVWVVAVNASAGAALGGTPTGWTLAASRSSATLAVGVYVQPANPGALTSVTFSSAATATTGGIASWFWEVDNCPFSTFSATSAVGSSTAPASGSVTPLPSGLMLGMVAWVLGTATFTNTSTNSPPWVTNAQQSSTGGTTNAAVRTGQTSDAFNSVAPNTWQGTLSASAQWVAAIVIVPSSASSGVALEAPSHAWVIDGGAGYSVGDAGSAGWSLGSTKPGAAGGGQ